MIQYYVFSVIQKRKVFNDILLSQCNIISVPIYAAGISPHKVRYHFEDISSVPQERISLKESCKGSFYITRSAGTDIIAKKAFHNRTLFFAGAGDRA